MGRAFLFAYGAVCFVLSVLVASSIPVVLARAAELPAEASTVGLLMLAWMAVCGVIVGTLLIACAGAAKRSQKGGARRR
jgi:hypothetical protein